MTNENKTNKSYAFIKKQDTKKSVIERNSDSNESNVKTNLINQTVDSSIIKNTLEHELTTVPDNQPSNKPAQLKTNNTYINPEEKVKLTSKGISEATILYIAEIGQRLSKGDIKLPLILTPEEIRSQKSYPAPPRYFSPDPTPSLGSAAPVQNRRTNDNGSQR